eukprot:243975_1
MADKGSINKFFLIQLCLNIYNELRRIFGAKALAFAIICVFINKYRAKKHDNIPGAPHWIPIIGHMALMAKYFKRGWLQKEVEIFNNLGTNGIFSGIMPTQKMIFVANPKIVDLVFRERFPDAIKAGPFEVLKCLLGDGIFTSNGIVWKKHRAIASHMFTVRSLRDYMFTVFNDTTDELLNKFDQLLENNDNIIDCYDMFNRLTFEAFTKIAFGVDVGAIDTAPQQAEFGFRFDRALALCTNRLFSGVSWKWKRKYRALLFGLAWYENEIDEHIEWIESYVWNIINDRKQYYSEKISNKSDKEKRQLKRGKSENKLRDRFDLLSMFIDDNKNITDKELRDITINFIIAGKDTTAQTMSWFMYHILTNKLRDIENKIREEIKNVFGTSDYNKLKVTYENVNKCNYIECCLKECLRLYPSVPHIVRSALKDIKTHNGYTIRKGDDVYVAIYAMGRMDWIWDEPEKFKPERFMDNKNQPDPSKYPAFNIAPRICLGRHVALLEMKIAIIKIFTKYKSISAVPNQDIYWVSSPTNQMSSGFKAYLYKN